MTPCELQRAVRRSHDPDPSWGFVYGLLFFVLLYLIAQVMP